MKKFNYIYLITNTLNNKIYIGKHSTDNLDDGYMGSGKLIKKAIQKYGIENFTKEYLAFCDTEEKLNWLEKFYIKKYKARENGYNLTDGGDGTVGLKPWNKGKTNVYSDETKLRISNSLKGHTPWNKDKTNIYSVESKQKMSQSHTGTRNGLYGKHHSIKTKLKLSKPKPKYQWLLPNGEIKIMSSQNINRWHPDWIKIGEV